MNFMASNIHQNHEVANIEKNPAFICKVPSGFVVLCGMQYLRGYSILQADPVVESLNVLNRPKRAEFLRDMAMVGDAMLEVTGAYRINYAIMGNSDPVLHAHIVPRYLTEPEDRRKDGPWSYPQDWVTANPFNYERDKELIEQLAKAIQAQL
jgi:diadenosine tetraphosphate (Ap4A) HIT family hydrolase